MCVGQLHQGLSQVERQPLAAPHLPVDGADDGIVNSVTPVGDDFDAAVVRDRPIDVHFGQANTAGYPSTGFLADARNGPLNEQSKF